MGEAWKKTPRLSRRLCTNVATLVKAQLKDYVWPAPALPEEIEACRKEAAKN